MNATTSGTLTGKSGSGGAGNTLSLNGSLIASAPAGGSTPYSSALALGDKLTFNGGHGHDGGSASGTVSIDNSAGIVAINVVQDNMGSETTLGTVDAGATGDTSYSLSHDAEFLTLVAA